MIQLIIFTQLNRSDNLSILHHESLRRCHSVYSGVRGGKPQSCAHLTSLKTKNSQTANANLMHYARPMSNPNEPS